ncbi:hypothetical protein BURMUCGD2M_1187 [Burkholderia multivorans CGD2M]|uniref:Uncharacterized protein n=1 Tax=Burkholderia multivorans CGD2 TaxID=513052 RepID=B9BQS2_9BURK|nr:hypothetical protein BURMUCGD2_1097 [Burkholderia multivorans CGD2]EEE13088.1 hypothetical protein BURMUCGD2M_1187 [Burkholderia multivorans CGD2M]
MRVPSARGRQRTGRRGPRPSPVPSRDPRHRSRSGEFAVRRAFA